LQSLGSIGNGCRDSGLNPNLLRDSASVKDSQGGRSCYSNGHICINDEGGGSSTVSDKVSNGNIDSSNLDRGSHKIVATGSANGCDSRDFCKDLGGSTCMTPCIGLGQDEDYRELHSTAQEIRSTFDPEGNVSNPDSKIFMATSHNHHHRL
jgi:hypothetical protein